MNNLINKNYKTNRFQIIKLNYYFLNYFPNPEKKTFNLIPTAILIYIVNSNKDSHFISPYPKYHHIHSSQKSKTQHNHNPKAKKMFIIYNF